MLDMQEVTGSSPVSPTILKFTGRTSYEGFKPRSFCPFFVFANVVLTRPEKRVSIEVPGCDSDPTHSRRLEGESGDPIPRIAKETGLDSEFSPVSEEAEALWRALQA